MEIIKRNIVFSKEAQLLFIPFFSIQREMGKTTSDKMIEVNRGARNPLDFGSPKNRK
jgi:hypothetical protein